MQKPSTILTFLLLLFVTSEICLAQAVSASPTRPSASDNAFLTQYKFLELEAGLAADENVLSAPLLLKLAISPKLEIGYLMNGLFVTQLDGGKSITKIGDPGLQLKYQFLKTNDVIIAGVIKSVLNKNDELPLTLYVTPSVLMPAGQLDATFGFTNYTGSNTIHYAAAFSPKTSWPVGFYVEFFGDKTSNVSFNYVDAGFSYSPKSTLVFDAAFVLGLGENTQSWLVQAGFTHTLGKVFK